MKHCALFILLSLTFACQRPSGPPREKESDAGLALDWWAFARSYPNGRFLSSGLFRAHQQEKSGNVGLREELPAWKKMGPDNIGGRTLCLAFDPRNPDVIFAGSAGGGLWKTTSAGKGAAAWSYVPTGFPVLAVAAIAIDPSNPRVMYIGTGEVYNYKEAYPGVADRLTRGTYGIGILKSTDEGRSWQLSLDWSMTDMRGVWDIIINPRRTQTVYAATTEGLFVSHDAGRSWRNIHPVPMAMDLELSPADTATLYVSHGSLNSPQRGLFRTRDGGRSFQKLTGLPDNFTGKTMLAISSSHPDTLYASVANTLAGRGLYRSADGGDSWTLVNTLDVPQVQGWYSHEIAVRPNDPNTLLYAGIEVYRSNNAGAGLQRKSTWSKWEPGIAPPAGGPEGPFDYVHSDIHDIYYRPGTSNVIFLATDGGIFVSENDGQSWAGRNGGYQTSQFYAEFASSPLDSNLAVGGLQDNATAIYTGSQSWIKHIAGDGMSAAIHPLDDHIIFGSFQFLSLRRSDDRGKTFSSLTVTSARGEDRCFNSPYVLAPSNPDIVYAGAERLHVSTDRGKTWKPASALVVDGRNPILTIAVSPRTEQEVIIATAPLRQGPAKVMRSIDGGQSWTRLTGLPDRLAMDVRYHPARPDTIFIAFSGFGTPHLYRSADRGNSWQPLDQGVPDVPASAIAIDPLNPDHLYLGNDLGVYLSLDGGRNWRYHARGMPDAAMVMDLSISPSNRKLRAATHGHGAMETALFPPGYKPEPPKVERPGFQVYPNPTRDKVTFHISTGDPAGYSLRLYNAKGQLIRLLDNGRQLHHPYNQTFDLGDLPAGVYFYEMKRTGDEAFARKGKLLKVQ